MHSPSTTSHSSPRSKSRKLASRLTIRAGKQEKIVPDPFSTLDERYVYKLSRPSSSSNSFSSSLSSSSTQSRKREATDPLLLDIRHVSKLPRLSSVSPSSSSSTYLPCLHSPLFSSSIHLPSSAVSSSSMPLSSSSSSSAVISLSLSSSSSSPSFPWSSVQHNVWKHPFPSRPDDEKPDGEIDLSWGQLSCSPSLKVGLFCFVRFFPKV